MKLIRVSLLIMFVLVGVIPVSSAQDRGVGLILEPVVVTATRQEEEVLRIPSHVTVITREDIQRSTATHVGDLLRSEAGLWVTNTSGSTPTGIFMDARGFNYGGNQGGRMLVLIDGQRSNRLDTMNPDWAAIPVESIERIEIVRGSSTTLYGDNAMVGVVNIITKKGAVEPSLRLSMDYRFYDCRDGKRGLERVDFDCWNRKVALSGTDEALSYYLYGGYESTDGFRKNSDYRASKYVGNFSYRVSPFSALRFRSSYLSDDRLLPGTLTKDDIALVGRDGSVTPGDGGGIHRGRFDVGFDSHLDQSRWIELTGGQILQSGESKVTIPDVGFRDLDNNNRSTMLTAKYRIKGQMAGRESRFIIGVDLLKEKVRAKSFDSYPVLLSPFVVTETTHYERRLVGAYIHEEFSIDPSLILTLSGRMDWSRFRFSRMEADLITNTTTESSGDRSFRVWSPKAGLTYRTSPTTSLFATWSKSFRFPDWDELNGFFGFTPELDPERATTYEIGSQMRVGRRLEGSVSVFRMIVEDEILFVPPAIGQPAFGENQNVPEVKHEGMEISSMARYSETFRLKGSYTFTRTEILKGPFEGSELPITPKHSGSATMDWGSGKGWMLSITGRFSGERFLANDLANAQEKLPSYTVFDARLQFFGDGFDAFFGINNVFDKEHEEFGGVGGFPFGSRIGVNPSPERNVVGGMTFHF